MREILFRARDTGGIWHVGELITIRGTDAYCGIRDLQHQKEDKVLCCTDTVGEYTGITDCTGQKIFEGDIVAINDNITGSSYDGSAFVVGYAECAFWAIPLGKPDEAVTLYNECAMYIVIGNVYDDAELLEAHDD